MTTVNVTLTPNVDTDQTASAQAQISAAPDGTVGNPTIINMPAGRYRIDGASGFGGLRLINRNHIRWTCLAGVETYPNAPTDAQAFVAYTDKSAVDEGFSARHHFMIKGCTDVIGSFLRIDGPNIYRDPNYPLFVEWFATKEAEHAFSIYGGCVDCGWEDCSYNNVYGDGIYVGFQGTPNTNAHVYRHTGLYAGRMSFSLTNVVGFTGIDITGDFAGFAGFDIEPNSPDDTVRDAYMEQIHMGSRGYPYTFQGGSPTRPSKHNITLKDSSVIRVGVAGFMTLITSQESDGGLVIDNLQDFRNHNAIGMQISGPWDNVTVKNCIIRTGDNASTSYAVKVHALESYTATNNVFKGYSGTEGFNNLTLFNAATPPIYYHVGNTWGPAGSLNDGLPPVALVATSGHVTLAGGTATLSVVPVFVPPPTFVPASFGGAPFRLRSHKGWGRLRGAMGARLRGSQGPAERHPMRLRSADGYGRLRSAQTPSFIRSMEPISNPATALFPTSGSVAIQGGTAALSVQIRGATSGQMTLAGGTATLAVVGTVYPVSATAGAISIQGGDHTLPMRLVATSGSLVLAGSATLGKRLPETSGQVTIAGGTALLGVRLAATSGQIALAGGVAGFNGQVSLAATSGTLTLSGGTATLSVRTAATTSGQISIQGGTATLGLTKIIHATPGELAILGGQAGLHKLFSVGTGTITIQGGEATLSFLVIENFTATAGQIHINGGTAHLNTYNQYPEWPMGDLADEWEMADA